MLSDISSYLPIKSPHTLLTGPESFCYNSQAICACSSVDRAPASGAGCGGSIPLRRTMLKIGTFGKAKVLFFYFDTLSDTL